MSGTEPAPSPTSQAMPAARRWSDLLPRLLSAVVMVALALGTAMLGGWVFLAFWLAAALAVLWEWQHLVGVPRARLCFALGAVALLAAALLLVGADAIGRALGALALGTAVVAGLAGPRRRALGGAGVVYAGALLLAVLALRDSAPGGLSAILWLFAVVWGTDVFAYFGGRIVGGPKLWPRFSPAKTWAGFLIGIGAGALLGLAVAPAGSGRAPLLLVGLLAGALAQGGDLFESALKRRFGVKDASHLIPGHGGVMDRLDGFLVAAVFAACLGAARAGLASAGWGLFDW